MPRRPLDFYPTPKLATIELLHRDGKTDSVTSAWFIWYKHRVWQGNAIEVIPRLNRQVVNA